MKKILNLASFPVITSLLFIIFVVLIKIYNISFLLLFFCFVSSSFVIFILSIVLKKIDLMLFIIFFIILFCFFYIKILFIENEYKTILKDIPYTKKVLGIVDDFPMDKDECLILKIKVTSIKCKNSIYYKKIKPFIVQLNLKREKDFMIERGDRIIINKSINLPIEKINNFYYRKYLAYKSIYGIIFAKPKDIEFLNDNNMNHLNKFLKTILWNKRNIFILKLKKNLDKKIYSFIIAIFFGVQSCIDEEVYNEFRNTGMIHVLSISGLHIGFIGLIFFKIFKFFLSKSKAYIISLIFLYIYILIIITSASSLRAFFMYLIAAVFFVFGVHSSRINILSISSIILQFINPYFIFDLGFQFSFLATLGILLFSQQIEENYLEKINTKFKSSISVTISAFISVVFLQWAMFNSIPLFSLISSIIVVPLFGILFTIMFFCLIFLYFFDLYILIKILEFSVSFFLKIIDILNIIPPVPMPDIPKYFSYIFIIFLMILFYIIEPLIFKNFSEFKVKRLSFFKNKSISK